MRFIVWMLLCIAPVLMALSSSGQSREEPLRLFTEFFPPYSMTVDGSSQAQTAAEIKGFVTDIVAELMHRAQVPYTLELIPWKRAYDNALTRVDHGVFSTTRTPQREDLFQWVGPIAENNWVFMGRGDSPIEIDDLQQARVYRIGGYLEDAIADYLVEQGLQIEYVANDALNVRKLARSRIDLWPVVQLKGIWLAKQEGIQVKEIYTIKRTVLALALNVQTDPKLVARLNRVLEEMHADGTVAAITRSYLEPGPPN